MINGETQGDNGVAAFGIRIGVLYCLGIRVSNIVPNEAVAHYGGGVPSGTMVYGEM